MKNVRKILVLMGFLAVLALFMGSVSAASLNTSDMGLASAGVKDYTETHGHIPGYVDVSDKNITTASFLEAVTTETVKLNQNDVTPVDVSSAGAAPSPSGSATGIVYKSEYVNIANRVSSFINTNGRAPNYASSSKGNIRYESLVYMYAKVVNYYNVNNRLPNYVTVVYYKGTDSIGVTIDNVPPTVSSNLAPGTYDILKNVTLTASDSIDANPLVYYSLDNGATWSNFVKTVTLNLKSGVTSLKYYARDASSNTGATQTAVYTINANAKEPPSLKNDDLQDLAVSVQSYVETVHQLPVNMTTSETTVNMSQFLELAVTALTNINNNVTTSIPLGSYQTASNSSETVKTSGNLNKIDYLNLAGSVKVFMDSNGRSPDYQTTNLGNMGYESLVYTFAQVLNSYKVAKVLPNFVTIRPWTTVANNGTVFLTMDQIRNAADTVQSYVETNHNLPDHVIILESDVNMPQFLKLETTYMINAKDNLYQSIVLQNYSKAPNPYESITGGNLNSEDYLSAASAISTFMDTNGYAPNYKTTIRGYIRYESLVYMYAEIINSASENLCLPSYVTLTPWTTVTNTNRVFLTMDQINTAASSLKIYVESNHALPENVNLIGRQVSTSQFLKLEILSLKNIYAGLYQSIVLKDYNAASSPSETVVSGKINYENYMNVADNINTFMNSNGRSPNYAWTSQGNMQFESLVYMYAQILDYYNVNKAIPEYITVNPWKVVSNPSIVTFNVDQIVSGAETVKSYVESNHAIPSSITISGITVSMPQFLRLATTTLHNINKDYTGQIILQNYGLPTDTSETIKGGNLNKTQYLDLAREVEYFMYNNGRAPNFQSSDLGNIRYQSLVYMYSQILTSYRSNNYTLPDFITVKPWVTVSNIKTVFLNLEELENTAKTLKQYLETNHELPSSVTISRVTVNMPQFLELLTQDVVNISGKLNATIILGNYNPSSSPSETVTGGNLNNTVYIDLANDTINYMNSNGRAPDYQTTSIGNMRFESLIYTYSLILNYYKENGNLPESVTVTPWSTISNTNTSFFTVKQLEDAAKTVQNYVETNHQLPGSVNIFGTNVNMSQFLQMAAAAVLNIDDSLYTSIAIKNFETASNPSETIKKQEKIDQSDYLNMARNVIIYMNSNGRAPDYQTTSMGNIGYESLVYMYSQILSSYNTTTALPEFVMVDPWTVVSNSKTVFVTTVDIKNASETLKQYVETNHQIPSSVNVAGRQITVPQFLKLSTNSVINVENYLNTSIILSNVGAPTSSVEDITSGTIANDEFVDIATTIKTYMDSNGVAPGNVFDTSLGSKMGYESIVYMFAKIMTSYNATEHAPDEVSVVPWCAVSNPNGTFNFRTQKIFNSIQAALNDVDTVSGDTIWLEKINYSENVVINKKITIKPLSGLNVTVQASNLNLPVFTINSGGNGTTIQDLIINGSINNVAIYINGSTDNQILGNNITSSSNGIYLYNSTETVISGNNILKNTLNGVLIDAGYDNEVSSNKITSNGSAGIKIQNAMNNRIYSNSLSGNQDGIYLESSSAEVHFNSIVGNTRYGLYSGSNSTVNATNNWWGSNSPNTSLKNPKDIYTFGETVNYNPWLILSLNSLTDRSDRNGTYYSYNVTVDANHNNQGNDTSSDGSIPDNTPINFNSTLGTLNSTGSTKKGKVELKLTNATARTADVSATLNNQTVSTKISVTNIDVLGVYNTRTHESFATIQAAINDVDTSDGDILTLNEGTYTENVLVNKRLTIQPITGANVTIKAKDSDKSVFVINNEGSGSTIRGLNILGANISYGISLSHTYNCLITNTVISDCSRDIYLYLSGNNEVTGNTIKGSTDGISLYKSISNNISSNIITKTETGIFLVNSNYNSITNNQITDNYYGNYIYHSNNIQLSGNNITRNWVGLYFYDTNNNSATENNLTSNGAGITYQNSIGVNISGNRFNDNWLTDTSTIDSGKVVMATTIYTCGPAALATLLKKYGIYTTEAELAQIAKTDETGTSLLGLKKAANDKGINAFGYELSIGQLKPDYIVVLKINGYNHFEVIQNINSDKVTLFDPNLGIVQMNLTTFNEIYTGYALVLNETIPSAVQLTDDQISNIRGLWHTVRTVGWRWHPGHWATYTKVINVSIPYPVLIWSYHHGWNIWTPVGYKEIGGFWYISGCAIRYYHFHYTIKIRYYVPGYPEMYVTYKRVADVSDINYKKFIATTFTVSSASIFGIDAAALVVSGTAKVSSRIAINGVMTTVGLSCVDFNSVVNPDPNPSGKGEGVINMIDPCWEPFLN